MRKVLSNNQPSPEATWLNNPNGYDAVVFVHGICGDQVNTWGKFPSLIHEDLELPWLDVLHWGYRSGFFPSNYLQIEAESSGLISDLRLLVEDGESISIIAHSMGGLVTLRGIIQDIANNRADVHPVSACQLLTLYATPLEGSASADIIFGVVDRIALLRWYSKYLPRKQLKDLRTDGFVDVLVRDVQKHISTVDVDHETPNNRMTVQVVLGKRDRSVKDASGIGPFIGNPPPLHLEGSHQSVKRPDHHRDDRYLAFKRNVVRKIAQRLHQWCVKSKQSAKGIDRKIAIQRIVEQYSKQLDACFNKCFSGRYLSDDEKRAVLITFLEFGSCGIYTPEQVVRMTIAQFIFSDDLIKDELTTDDLIATDVQV